MIIRGERNDELINLRNNYETQNYYSKFTVKYIPI